MASTARREGLGCAIAVAVTVLLVAGGAAAAPKYPRLSFTGDPATTMTVAWNTDADTGSEVHYGTTSGSLTATATGTSFQATAGLGFVHEVTLTGLAPATVYYYVAGSQTDGFSAEARFTTGPTADENCGSLSFVFLGDNRPDATFGGGQNWPQILGQAWSQLPAFVLNGGDLVIDGDRIDQWNKFLGDTAPVSANLPLMPTLGNHDTGPGQGDGANYNQLFALPRSTGTYGSNTEDYYYFTYGNAIFAALSTHSYETGTPVFQQQADWLDEVLTQNPRKWRFVYYHAPSYSDSVGSFASHPPNEESQNAALVPVIDAHHVDAVFTSHNHWYERFHPTACANQGSPGSDSPCSVGAGNFAAGTVFYVSGGAGAFTIPQLLCGSMSGRALCSGAHHYILATIDDETLTLATWSAFPQNHEVIDSITITNAADTCAPVQTDGGVPDGATPADGPAPGDGPAPADGPAPGDGGGAATDGPAPA
ncbi:MAG: metallophosphoesterase family protein, partial [Deltaproteobacteria bacterium]|nr:metallophosphoesterase family protein [Deltaproteobacteria bacterium]